MPYSAWSKKKLRGPEIQRGAPIKRGTCGKTHMQFIWINQLSDEKLEVDWLGAGHHNYGDLVALDLPQGSVTWNDLETNHREVTPKV